MSRLVEDLQAAGLSILDLSKSSGHTLRMHLKDGSHCKEQHLIAYCAQLAVRK